MDEMSGWTMILIGLAIAYALVAVVSYVGALNDKRYSDRYRKENARHVMFGALRGMTIFIVVVAIALTAFVFVGSGVYNLINPMPEY